MLHAGFILRFTLVCCANQHKCRSVVAADKNDHILTHEVSASCLPQVNASHCKAMLHAGFILRFTLVCNANQHFSPSFFKKSGICFAPDSRKTGNINLSCPNLRNERSKAPDNIKNGIREIDCAAADVHPRRIFLRSLFQISFRRPCAGHLPAGF